MHNNGKETTEQQNSEEDTMEAARAHEHHVQEAERKAIMERYKVGAIHGVPLKGSVDAPMLGGGNS